MLHFFSALIWVTPFLIRATQIAIRKITKSIFNQTIIVHLFHFMSLQNSMEHQQPKPSPPSQPSERDLLTHIEAYIAKREGVDKLLRTTRYATQFILASSLLHKNDPLTLRLKTFEKSVGLSRQGLFLGTFIQQLNALRVSCSTSTSHQDLIVSVVTNCSAGLYNFVQQLVWLSEAGLISKKHSKRLQKLSAWCYFVTSVGSLCLTLKELSEIVDEEEGEQDEQKLEKLRRKKFINSLSVLQDLIDGLMCLAYICCDGGKRRHHPAPFLESSAGLCSALISTYKAWASC